MRKQYWRHILREYAEIKMILVPAEEWTRYSRGRGLGHFEQLFFRENWTGARKKQAIALITAVPAIRIDRVKTFVHLCNGFLAYSFESQANQNLKWSWRKPSFWSNHCMTALEGSSSTFWILQRWPFSEMEDRVSSAVRVEPILCLLCVLPKQEVWWKKALKNVVCLSWECAVVGIARVPPSHLCSTLHASGRKREKAVFTGSFFTSLYHTVTDFSGKWRISWAKVFPAVADLTKCLDTRVKSAEQGPVHNFLIKMKIK